MGKSKLEALQTKVALKQKTVSEAEKAIADLEDQISMLSNQAKEAADAGDFDQYKIITDRKEAAQAELFVKQSYVSTVKSGSITEEEVKAAWSEYADGYNKQFDKLFSEYESKRNSMLNAYAPLIDLQEKALTVQKQLRGYIGSNSTEDYQKAMQMDLPCRLLPNGTDHYVKGVETTMTGTGTKDPDAVFYMANFAREHNNNFSWTDPEADRLNRIISRRKAF